MAKSDAEFTIADCWITANDTIFLAIAPTPSTAPLQCDVAKKDHVILIP